MSISITGNIDDADKLITNMQNKGSNKVFMLNIAAEETRKDVIQNFKGEHDPHGNKWAALSAYTLERKKGVGILRESDDLFNEMSSKENYRVIDGTLEIFTTVQGDVEPGDDPFYGYHHNEGLGQTQRQFVDYTDKIHNKVEDRIYNLFND